MDCTVSCWTTNVARPKSVLSEGKILDHLLNKPYVNGVSLGEQNLYSKYY